MLINRVKKQHKLFNEILLLVCLCFALSLLLFVFVVTFCRALIEEYCFQHNIIMDELEWYQLDNTLRGVGFALSVLVFVILFFVVFGERLAYVRKITAGVRAMQNGDYDKRIELVGNNELTGLAEAVNYLSEGEKKIKEKEKRLKEEREELIRTLSHDIRTPLTSIMSYTEFFAAKATLTPEEQHEYLSLVNKKTTQIKELTDILLDGGHREVEQFDDARLLFEQLASDFEEELEEAFKLSVSVPSSSAFSGSFDVGELRRIFDNLISNIKKYADSTAMVELSIYKIDSGIIIKQSNAIKTDGQLSESYKLGLHSIRRIVQNYGGKVEVSESDKKFTIIITLSNI